MDRNKDPLALLEEAVAKSSQAAVARELDYSASTVNQILQDTYTGKRDAFYRRVIEVYGSEKIQCPILGEIPLGRCAKERKRPFAATNPVRVRLHRACRECEVAK